MSVLARAHARKLLKKYFIESPAELELEKMANSENLIIEECELNNFIGLISYTAAYGLIKINSSIKEQRQKRFVIAHEMGHYYNHSKNGAGCSFTDLLSYKSQSRIEAEANAFASELLMPKEWILDFVKKNKPSANLLIKASEYFNVSLSAAGIRIAETDAYPFAVIMSTNGVVKWSTISASFPFYWIPIGYKVNNNSYAFDLFAAQDERLKTKDATNMSLDNRNKTIIIENSEPEEVLADAWFWDDRNYKKDYYMFEQNIDMPGYNSVLTILWVK